MGKYEADRKRPAPKSVSRETMVHRTSDAPSRSRPTAQQIASRRKAMKDQRIAIIVGCSILLVLLIALIVGLIVYANRPGDDGKILPNVYAAGIDLGGMTPEEAASALHLATDKTFSQKDMIITLPDSSLTLSPEDTGAKLDVDAVVDAAYAYGRGGSAAEFRAAQKKASSTTHTIALLPYLDLDLSFIGSAIQEFCSSYGSTLTQPTIQLQGTRPAYDPEYPDLFVDHQTLVITMGTPDYALVPDRVYDRVLDSYSLNQLSVTYEAPTLTEPSRPTAEDLFKEYCTEPVDAAIDDVTFEVTPEVYGYGFQPQVLQAMIDSADYGETIRIELDFIMPQVTAQALTKDLFVDLLASYTTSNLNGNSDARNTNLRLSAEAIDGIVIKAGAEFSFNNVMGRPTPQKGYQLAAEYQNGLLTDVIGGGVSQTASALYYCALMADLDVLERNSNSYAVDYTPLGLDAYIDWGARDLRLRNNTGAPIRIIAYASGGDVTVQLRGVDERDYQVQINSTVISEEQPETFTQVVDRDNVYNYVEGQIIQFGITGYQVQTSIDKIDKLTGTLISSTLVDTSTYSKRDQIVIQIETDVIDPDPSDPTAPTDPTDPGETGPTEPSTPPSLDDLFEDLFG